MNKSATGTEYVNAQMEELKLKIDELAGELHGTTMGLVYAGLFIRPCAFVHVALITDMYRDQVRCTLHVYGTQWNGSQSYHDQTVEYYGSMLLTEDRAIPEGYRPAEALTDSYNIYWRSGSNPGGTVSIQVSTSGRLQVNITGSGRFNQTFRYYL